MNVEFTEIKRGFMLHQLEYEDKALSVLRTGWYILGDELTKFECEFSNYLGRKHCIGVGNGTDALILAFRALGIGPGDEVLVPAGTYIASVMGVTENGATPIFVDSDEFLVMNGEDLEGKISPKTKAILPVHLYGQPCDMEKIMDVAHRYDLFVVEDCAQCHGSTYKGQMTGTFGDIACFSFYPTKPLGAFGDAGALVTDDDVLADRLYMLRNYGSKLKYHNELQGVNTRMDELQAGFLRVGLKYLEEGNRERHRIADRYMSEIKHASISLPCTRDDCTHVFHIFPLICEDRDGLQMHLLDHGIKTQIHYPVPPYAAECYSEFGYKLSDFPNAGYIATHELSLPIYAGMPEDEVDYVISMVNKY